MLHGWGRICRTKLNDAKTVYLSLKYATIKKNYWTNKNVRGLVLLRVQGLLTSPTKLTAHSVETLRIWKLLEWLGVSHCRIVIFRRKLKRFAYPWLYYSIPAGLILGIGDIIAQYHLAPHPADRTISQFFSRDWIKERTLVYVLLGMFLVGPVLSKWDLFWYRKLRCKPKEYLVKKTLLDLFILSPILLTLMAVIFDQRYGVNIITDAQEKTKKQFECKYIPAVLRVLEFNCITRPIMAVLMCYLVPCHLRKSFRTLYEVIFATYLSDSFYQHKLRFPAPPPPPPPPPESKTPCTKKKPSKSAFRWPC